MRSPCRRIAALWEGQGMRAWRGRTAGRVVAPKLATMRLAAMGLVLGALGSAGAARAETLADAIALAYQTNPTLQGQRAQLRALDESYVQAHAGLRPQANVQAQQVYQNGPSTLDVGVTIDQANLNLSQPIYTG